MLSWLSVALRRGLDFFWERADRALVFDDRSIARAETTTRFFYASCCFLAYTSAPRLLELAQRSHLDPLWPVAWVARVSLPVSALAIALLFLVSSLLAVFTPGSRVARATCAFFMLESVALQNSFGKINHSSHTFVLAAIVLVFLPKNDSVTYRVQTLRSWFGVTVVALATYTVAGTAKIRGAAIDLFRGDMSVLHPDALAVIIARQAVVRGQALDELSPLAGALIEYPVLGWPFMLGAIALEVGAVLAPFVPAVYRPWLLSLLAMHFGILFIMGISFGNAVLLLLILFVGPVGVGLPTTTTAENSG